MRNEKGGESTTEKKNWLQEQRMRALQMVNDLARIHGGWSTVLSFRRDFEKTIMNTLGCSEKTAQDYIDTIRGALIFQAKIKDLERQRTIDGKSLIPSNETSKDSPNEQ